MPYTTARLMDLLSVEAMTFTFTTTRHPVAVPILALVPVTVHRVGTAPTHFWQALISLLQTK